MKQKLQELQGPNGALPWIERLDLVSDQAPLAPELAFQESQVAKGKAKARTKAAAAQAADVHDDFKREMAFYRQAQAAVLQALPRLRSMNIRTKRPEDYFAQMAKSDEHMQKVRQKLVSKQAAEERLDKIRKLRELRKFGKKVQVEVQQKRQKEKRDMLEQVKKFRKGQTDKIDFLEDQEGSQQQGKRKGNPQRYFIRFDMFDGI